MLKNGFLIISALLLVACGGTDMDDPRQVVISLFGAMEKDDQATLTRLLDMAELMRNTQRDYALGDENVRSFTNPEQILEDLTGDGKTKQVWFSMQRIVNGAEVMGETATVDVTFINKSASKGYLTTFGLHRQEGKWRIFSFKTVED